jgi:hypothetical protein
MTSISRRVRMNTPSGFPLTQIGRGFSGKVALTVGNVKKRWGSLNENCLRPDGKGSSVGDLVQSHEAEA